MYTKVQICSHFGIHRRTFDAYRAKGIVGPPQIDGNSRYYSHLDIKRIREVRTLVDQRATLSDYAEQHPHPDLPPPESFEL